MHIMILYQLYTTLVEGFHFICIITAVIDRQYIDLYIKIQILLKMDTNVKDKD